MCCDKNKVYFHERTKSVYYDTPSADAKITLTYFIGLSSSKIGQIVKKIPTKKGQKW